MTHKNDQGSDDETDRIEHSASRRQLLTTLGAAGAVSFAGCASGDGDDGGDGDGNDTDGGGGDGGGDGDGSGSEEFMDPIFSTSMLRPPEKYQFNRYNPRQGPSSRLSNSIWGVLVDWHDGKSEWIADGAKDWNVDLDVMKVSATLKDFEWWSGDPVTAQDVATQFKLDYFMEVLTSKFDYIDHESIVADGKTFEADLTREVNPDVLIMQALDTTLSVRHGVYKKHLETFEDATTESEKESAQEELFNRRIEDPQPVGHGLWKITEIKPQKYIGKLHDGHWAADNVNGYGAEWISTQQREGQNIQHQMVRNGEIDALMEIFVDDKFMDSMPDKFQARFPNVPTFYGRAQLLNQDHELYGDVRVRKAIAYLDDHTTYPSLGRHAVSIKDTHWTSISKFVIDKFIDPEEQDKLYTDYTERNVEKATALLKEAGFTKEDGTFYRPNGDPWAPTIKTAPEKAKHSRMTANNLKEVGVQAEVKTVDPSTMWSETLEPGKYELTTVGWGSIYNWHPYAHYRDTFTSGGDLPYADLMNVSPKQEVPMPVGDPEGSTETIDMNEVVTEMGAVTGDRQKELVKLGAWVYNQTVPHNPGPEAFITQYLSGDHWELPPEDDPDNNIGFPAYWLPKFGKLQAKTK